MEDHAIRSVRARSNAALAAVDLQALSECWAPDYTIVTSTNARSRGRAASVERLTLEYQRKPDLVIVREPLRIEVFAPWGMAAEQGKWETAWRSPGGRVSLSGTYHAKWQKYEDAGWLIEAEIFVPLACDPQAADRPLPSLARPT